jgi:hypothetical protein
VSPVLFVRFAGEEFGAETDGAGVQVESVDVVLCKEADAETRVLGD